MYHKWINKLPDFISSIGLKGIYIFHKIENFLYKQEWKKKYSKEEINRFNEFNKRRYFGPRPVFCYAPFNNLYFGINGEIVACCFNRQHILGKFPKDSLNEIWTGEAIKQLRIAVKNFDLSKGCQLCKMHIDSRNYDALPPIYYDMLPVKKKYPASIEFELSNACNLSCVMCSERFSSSCGAEKKVYNNYDSDFLSQLDEFIPHLYQARFFGGEPFLIELYYKIWEKIINLNPKCIITIQTNATILNNKIKSMLGQGRFNIGISLESIRKEMYETVRIGADYFQVMQNIEYFISYCHQKSSILSFAICPMTLNWQEIPELVTYCNQQKGLIYFNTVLSPEKLSLKNLKSTQLNDIIEFYRQHHFPGTTIFERKNRRHFTDFIELLSNWEQQAKKAEEKLAIMEKEKVALMNIPISDLSNMLYEKIQSELMRTNKYAPEIKQIVLSKCNELLDCMNVRFSDLYEYRLRLKSLVERTNIDNMIETLINNDIENLEKRFIMKFLE